MPLTRCAYRQDSAFLVLIRNIAEALEGHHEALQSRYPQRHVNEIDPVLVPEVPQMGGGRPKKLRIKIIGRRATVFQ